MKQCCRELANRSYKFLWILPSPNGFERVFVQFSKDIKDITGNSLCQGAIDGNEFRTPLQVQPEIIVVGGLSKFSSLGRFFQFVALF